MDLNEIREIIEQDGGKFIIVENGKPIFVIISFNEYKGKISSRSGLTPAREKINFSAAPEIPAEKNQPEVSPELNGEVNIDDLPLD